MILTPWKVTLTHHPSVRYDPTSTVASLIVDRNAKARQLPKLTTPSEASLTVANAYRSKTE